MRAVSSVGDFFGVTQQSQQRLNHQHGAQGVRSLRRTHGTQPNNSYVDTNYLSPEFLGEIDIPIEFLGFEDGALPAGKEHLFIRDRREALEYYKTVADLKIEEDGFFGGQVARSTAPQSGGRGDRNIRVPKKNKTKKEQIKGKLKVCYYIYNSFSSILRFLSPLGVTILLALLHNLYIDCELSGSICANNCRVGQQGTPRPHPFSSN